MVHQNGTRPRSGPGRVAALAAAVAALGAGVCGTERRGNDAERPAALQRLRGWRPGWLDHHLYRDAVPGL